MDIHMCIWLFDSNYWQPVGALVNSDAVIYRLPQTRGTQTAA